MFSIELCIWYCLMKKIFFSFLLSALGLSGGATLAQPYDYCIDDSGDRYWVGTLYEYGHGYPVELRDAYDADYYPSEMDFSGYTTMYSVIEDRQIPMVDGEDVNIAGLMFVEDCTLQLLVYSHRLGKIGFVPAFTVAVP